MLDSVHVRVRVLQRSDMSAQIYQMEVKSYCSVACIQEANTSDITTHYFIEAVWLSAHIC